MSLSWTYEYTDDPKSGPVCRTVANLWHGVITTKDGRQGVRQIELRTQPNQLIPGGARIELIGGIAQQDQDLLAHQADWVKTLESWTSTCNEATIRALHEKWLGKMADVIKMARDHYANEARVESIDWTLLGNADIERLALV